MKIFAIHRGKDSEEVKKIKKKLINSPQIKLLVLENTDIFWKIPARKIIKQADVAIYFVGENTSDNIDWEIRIAEKYGCKVFFMKLNESAVIPDKYYGYEYDNEKKLKYTEINIDDFEEMLLQEETPIVNILFNTEDNIPDEYMLEQYKMFLESTEKHVDRRQQLTATYMAVVTALIPVIIFMLSSENPIMVISTVIISIIDILLSVSWLKMISAYGKVSSSKYEILQQIEKKLPLSILLAEWTHLSAKEQNYVSFTKREQAFPSILICVNIALMFVAIILFISMII